MLLWLDLTSYDTLTLHHPRNSTSQETLHPSYHIPTAELNRCSNLTFEIELPGKDNEAQRDWHVLWDSRAQPNTAMVSLHPHIICSGLSFASQGSLDVGE